MESGFLDAIGILGVLAITGFAIKTNVDVNKKVDNTFKRLDIVKKDFEENHVRKDVCKVVHDQLSRDVTEIKADVKCLLQKIGSQKKD